MLFVFLWWWWLETSVGRVPGCFPPLYCSFGHCILSGQGLTYLSLVGDEWRTGFPVPCLPGWSRRGSGSAAVGHPPPCPGTCTHLYTITVHHHHPRLYFHPPVHHHGTQPPPMVVPAPISTPSWYTTTTLISTHDCIFTLTTSPSLVAHHLSPHHHYPPLYIYTLLKVIIDAEVEHPTLAPLAGGIYTCMESRKSVFDVYARLLPSSCRREDLLRRFCLHLFLSPLQ